MARQSLPADVPFSSIRVRVEDKRVFDRLRHEVALQTGEHLTQHELFHRIMEAALVAKWDAAGAMRGTASHDWTRFQFELDEATDAASEVDRVVYGSDT